MKSKEFKDFSFELFGTTWNVKFIEKSKELEDGKYELGNSNYMTNTITVSTHDADGNPLSEENVKLTLFHEIVHSIFATGSYISSTEDEPLVEWTARCINSLLKQQIFEYAK